MDPLQDELLAQWRRRGMTIDDLVDAVERLLPMVADRQTRYKVTERPDVRTIRYYVTRGLLPRAEGYQAGRARYGGSHLLRLLLVKKLQAEHHTLSRIQATLADVDDRGVLGLLLGRAPDAMEMAPDGTPDTGSAAAEDTPASSEPPPALRQPADAALGGHPMLRIPLPGGASLDLPAALMASASDREALASTLESVASRLRGAPPSDAEEGEPS